MTVLGSSGVLLEKKGQCGDLAASAFLSGADTRIDGGKDFRAEVC